MSNPTDGIPQAVAAIVSACYGATISEASQSSVPRNQQEKDEDLNHLENRLVSLTERLTQTFIKAIRDAETAK